jgi:hypothetical protein
MNVAAIGIGVLGLLIGAELCLVALFKALGSEKVEDIADLRLIAHRPDQDTLIKIVRLRGGISAHASSKEV